MKVGGQLAFVVALNLTKARTKEVRMHISGLRFRQAS